LTPGDLRRRPDGVQWHVGDVLLGWYRIEAIRLGGFGRVYLCRHTQTQEGQAIKTVQREPLSHPKARGDMVQEAEAWAMLELHPNIVGCHFIHTTPVDKRLWLGLERVDGDPDRGTTLREWMRRAPLTQDTVVRIALGICDAMTHVSTAALVHRDLKPENVLITAAGFAKVTDFGLARPLTENVDGTSVTVAGTPRYMPPESWRPDSPVSPAGDVYAFGMMLWELLAGAHPFDSAGMPLWLAHRDVTPADPRTINPNASVLLSSIAQQCLAKVSDARPTFADVAARIRQEWPTVRSADNSAPIPIGTMCNRIDALTTVGKVAEAQRLLDRALERAPDHVLVHEVRVSVFKMLGQLGRARDSLAIVARVKSASPGVLMMKSEALWDLGRGDEALAALDEALRVEPDNGWCLAAKGEALVRLGRDDAARVVLEQCARNSRESGSRALILLADLERARGRSSEAFEYLSKAYKQNPNDENTLWRLARMLSAMGQHDRALRCAQRATLVNPRSVQARLVEADLLESAGRLQEAEALLRQVVTESSTMNMAAINLGLLLNKTGRSQEAMTYFRQAAQAQPQNAYEYLAKALVLGPVFKQWREVIACVDVALVLQPASVPALMLKGDAHTYFGELDLARQAYQQAAAFHASDREVAQKMEALDALEEGQALTRDRPSSTTGSVDLSRPVVYTNDRTIRVIRTTHGDVSVSNASDDQLAAVARQWPFGLHPGTSPGAPLRLGFHRTDQPLRCIKFQQVDFSERNAVTVLRDNIRLVASALPSYLKAGHPGVMAPVPYFRPKPPGKVETGIAYFCGPVERHATADGDRRFDEYMGRGATRMILDFQRSIALASRAAGIRFQYFLSMEPRHAGVIGRLDFRFLIVGTSLLIVDRALVPDNERLSDEAEQIWGYLARAGLTTAAYARMTAAVTPDDDVADGANTRSLP
jgi:tetratricopeptide (TPR) repeat protein